MELFKKWRKDKNFRKNVIIGLVVLFFLSNYMGNTVEPQIISQSTCNQFNHIGMWNECKAEGCAVDVANHPIGLGSTISECIQWFGEIFFDCVSPAPDTRFMAKDESTANGLCGEGKKAVRSESFCYQPMYLCITDESPSCKSWEKIPAGILDSIWKENKIDSCSTKAYIVLAIGVFALLAVV